MGDGELRRALADILDHSVVEMSEWERKFIVNVTVDYLGPLSDRQRSKAMEIIKIYGVGPNGNF